MYHSRPPGSRHRVGSKAREPSRGLAITSGSRNVAPPSSLYASRRRVENLSQALTVLGLNATLTLALGFSLAILAMAWLRPGMVYWDGQARPLHDEDLMPLRTMLAKLVPIVLLIASVLGGIYAGIFTATEAGAVGALMALIIALSRRKLDWRGFREVLVETGHVTVSVSFLIICANVYTRMLAMSGTPQAMVEWMAAAGLGVTAFLTLYLGLILLLGTIIDSSSILLIVLPLMLPIAQQFNLDLIWFGVITVVAVEVGLLTPPFGLSVYVIKSTLADTVDISLGDIFRGTGPFTLTMLAVLGLLVAFPQLSLVLLK